jgi:Fic family protein
VWNRTAALNTWGTNAIEGSTISYEDAQRLLLDRVSVGDKPVRDVMETIQHERAFRSLLQRRQADITMRTALELHEVVFREILLDAGQWRRENVRIRGARYSPPRMEKVLGEMEAWDARYRQRNLEGENVFGLGAWMHYHFERIHPFRDGNGRVGRLLLNLHFLKHSWPPVHILPQQRGEYLSSLNLAARDDLGPLEELLKKTIGASLVDLLDQVGTSEDELVPLKEAAGRSPYGEQYLALRCKQGELPALKTNGRWMTSMQAVQIYMEVVGRKTKKSGGPV